MKRRIIVITLTCCLVLGGCSKDTESPVVETVVKEAVTTTLVREVGSPAAPGSAEPHLVTSPEGAVVMSWFEPVADTDRHAIRFASWRDGAWSEPRTIVERNDFFVNWADFPTMAISADGAMFVHWPQKSGEGTYAYDVVMSISTDGGDSWAEPFVVHDDGTQTEHGFVSLMPIGEDSVAAIWLDGRAMTEGSHDDVMGSMTLRYAEFSSSGQKSNETLLDDRTCECCQTSLAMTSQGPIVLYRDRSVDEIRDISVIRKTGDGWSEPASVFDDGWKIDGCPVNGPRVEARGDRVVAAWFSGANDERRVFAALSTDGGATFGDRTVVDDGKPAGRVDLEMLSDGSAVVTWIEQIDESAEVRARRIIADGSMDESIRVGETTTARSAGFPRSAGMAGDSILFAWTEPGDPSRIRTSLTEWKGITR